MDISIIIPVYNKEAYLESCLHGLLTQEFRGEFEIVAVDDGSTDRSGLLCDQIAREDPRIRVHHTVNGGVTAARRYGVQHSRGRYVMFVDSDDELLPGALQTLYDAIEREGADEVIGVYRTQHGRIGDSGRRGWQDTESMVYDLLALHNSFCVLWGIIFRRELLDGCLDTPREVIEAEDILMQIKCLMKHPKVFFIAEQVYLYNEGLPNNRWTGIDRMRIYDRELEQALRLEWDTYRRGYLWNRIKHYESYIALRQFDVYEQYYKDLEAEDLSGIPWADRIAFALPPRIAFFPIWLRKRFN